MREYEAGILRTERRTPGGYIIEVACGEIAQNAVPGQFVQARAGRGTDPFLRRTFSICGSRPEYGIISLMIDVVGLGTALLCSLKRGEMLNLVGPLGNGFDQSLGGNGSVVLVAGGFGAAPLLFLAESIRQSGKRPAVFLMGGKTVTHLSLIEGLICESVSVLEATDDGSRGYHGLVSFLLEERMGELSPGALYACGPRPMMKAVAKIAKKSGVPCQVSLEERMACGIGVCLGCAVRMADGSMVRSCKEGPVFDADEVSW
ncbi:MAG: dihydroorotate dehydrogenase electron transfer subunit [Candidatus Latescibacter sp.]|nr:dihydroorotate dehydrogenase electron transfer subunit [Candidatus Latescibacter sp.]